MGDVADMMLDGTLCEQCGAYMGEPSGTPVSCGLCSSSQVEAVKKVKFKCGLCGKGVAPSGAVQHLETVHGIGRDPNTKLANRTPCKVCGKMIKVRGMADHILSTHKMTKKGETK